MRRLTKESGSAWPALSPDGRKIAFQTGFKTIYVMKVDGTARRLLVRNGNNPAWSPDGTRIAYWVGGARAHAGIYVIGANSGATRRLTVYGSYPAWSPDGRQIASWGCNAAPQRICVTSVDGTGQHVISRAGGIPAWSPDGTRIAYQGGWPHVRISVINTDGSGRRILPPHISYKNQDCNLAWSPDGKQIAFSRGQYEGIFLMNADGTAVTKLTGSANSDGGPGDCGVSWRPIRPNAR